MSNDYALFDWDNTVRKGYTLFSWIDFLCEKSILNCEFENEINAVKLLYSLHKITHDQYAKTACEKYAYALKGIPKQLINDACMEYMAYDRKALFANIGDLFNILHDNGIDVIVISGAPMLVLSKYMKEFHVTSLYAFKEATINGVFTGKVHYNYGFNKALKVQEIIDRYGKPPLFAFGDSVSDIPMLECTANPFCVGNGLNKYNNIIITRKNRFPASILSTIRRILKNRNALITE